MTKEKTMDATESDTEPVTSRVPVPPAPPNAWPPRTEEPRPYHDGDPQTHMRSADPALKAPAARRTAVSLGRQVHALRTGRGLTQQQAAVLLGWDQPQWARLEAGRVYPTLATLDLLATRLGLRIVLTPDAYGLLVTLEEVAPAA